MQSSSAPAVMVSLPLPPWMRTGASNFAPARFTVMTSSPSPPATKTVLTFVAEKDCDLPFTVATMLPLLSSVTEIVSAED